MHRHTRSDAGDLSSPRSSRAASFSSDRPSLSGSATFQMPANVRPPAGYIAASVASQIVTDHHNAQLQEDYDSDNDDAAPVLVNALFSEPALGLLNAFLDHLLFSILSTARSPSLTAIRPAISDVLKPRLAREAMVTADEELQGLLAGEDDEEFPRTHNGQDSAEKWDVEKVWKRTRLRIMVYTRLGELEDEDEERYVQQERGLSMDESDDDEAGLVSWAAAIFLTSVIEYIAEQTLMVSGQAAFARMSAKLKKTAPATTEDDEEVQLERIIVEDFDVEKVALNSALGRLWRTWRKRVRSPITPLGHSRGPRSMSSFTSLHRRRVSHETMDEAIDNSIVPEVPEHKPSETDIAANIPLPMSDNDVAEIEVPGLARQFDDEGSGAETPVPRPQRPTSYIALAPVETFWRKATRERPVSMPPPTAQPFVMPQAPSLVDDHDFVTPFERMPEGDSYMAGTHPEEEVHDGDEGHQNEVAHASIEEPQERRDSEHDANMVAFAASTGMGFAMSPIDSTDSKSHEKSDADTIDTPTKTHFDDEPQVLHSKRMSIEKSGPPGIVRTYSARSSLSRSPSLATQGREGKSYLDDSKTDDEMEDHEAIGVARTSNVPITSPSPPAELAGNDMHPGYARHHSTERAVYDISAARHIPSTTASPRKTPSPPAERPMQVERSVQRKELPSKPVAGASRGPALAALREAESWSSKPTQELAASPEPRPVSDVQRNGIPQGGSPKSSSARRSREHGSPVAERAGKRGSSVESGTRSRSGTTDGVLVEKSTLQRVSSSASSTAKSVSTSILHSARDSDLSIGGRPRNLSTRMSEEDREREFDSLVKGDETVKYTLTPQAMREMEASSAAASNVEPPRPATAVTVYPRVNADKDNAFGSQPPMPPAQTDSRSRGSSTTRRTGPKPLAREPRIQGESMRDFADFIRSTGPAAEPRPVQPFVSLSNSTSPRSPPPSSSPISGLGRKLSTRHTSNIAQSSQGAGEGPSARPRMHMEPRNPAGLGSGNNDLIDFIRQGPPGANNGQPRIPRTVAPFRTTVDSDQFDRMLDDNNNDGHFSNNAEYIHNLESTYGSELSTNSKQSVHTSNSRTGLIPTPTVVQPAYSNTPQNLTGSLNNPEPQIKRTRRRVKDPYAIDTDDEDDDLLTALPAGKTGQPPAREESLMDFLSSMEPPAVDDKPKPFLLSEKELAAAKARARQHANMNMGSSSSRNGVSRTLPPATISSSITSEAPRARGPKLQARAASARDTQNSERSATSDLADFLRTSGPPEPSAPPPGATIRKEESTGGKRLNAKFWRKKTYGDMP
ncbi:hypothetical protein BCR34DRAFT_18215 [Clohesyomyces aquaticus]|uniref:Uncharacterized protein n=1 Tax=Clohesyomyces aquaticus TaxID=1231657 RepID=A0A1Y1ZBM3_9PLEO|nr:hypothetical protein BCR34DRAFT_18215 [Clohesyomyces aquaticus]